MMSQGYRMESPSINKLSAKSPVFAPGTPTYNQGIKNYMSPNSPIYSPNSPSYAQTGKAYSPGVVK